MGNSTTPRRMLETRIYGLSTYGEQVQALLGDAGPTVQVRSWCSA